MKRFHLLLMAMAFSVGLPLAVRPGACQESPTSEKGSAAAPQPLAGTEGLVGSLVIVGGGSVPSEIHREFVKRSGPGPVVIIPTASGDPIDSACYVGGFLYELGATDLIGGYQLEDREDDIKNLAEMIAGATGVWITGGDQRRLADAYQGTEVELQLKRLLERGGVIGGTSAGAAIMSSVMISGGERTPEIASGWDLLPRAIVDQHFSQRRRIARSRAAVQMYPDRFGIGIDERTAAIVSGTTIEVLGPGTVTLIVAANGEQAITEKVLEQGHRVEWTTLLAELEARESDDAVDARQ